MLWIEHSLLSFYRDSIESADEAAPAPTLGKWTLICSTEEDWQTFVKQLKKSTNRQDKKLRKIIVNDFLPLIPEIIEEKVSDVALSSSILDMDNWLYTPYIVFYWDFK